MQPSQRNSVIQGGGGGGRSNQQSINRGSRYNRNGQASPSYTPPPPKRDVSEIHFSEIVDLDANDKQKISDMMKNYVSLYL